MVWSVSRSFADFTSDIILFYYTQLRISIHTDSETVIAYSKYKDTSSVYDELVIHIPCVMIQHGAGICNSIEVETQFTKYKWFMLFIICKYAWYSLRFGMSSGYQPQADQLITLSEPHNLSTSSCVECDQFACAHCRVCMMWFIGRAGCAILFSFLLNPIWVIPNKPLCSLPSSWLRAASLISNIDYLAMALWIHLPTCYKLGNILWHITFLDVVSGKEILGIYMLRPSITRAITILL